MTSTDAILEMIGLGFIGVDMASAGEPIKLTPTPRPWLVIVWGHQHAPEAFEAGMLHLAFALSKGTVMACGLDLNCGDHFRVAIEHAKRCIGRPIVVTETTDATHWPWVAYARQRCPILTTFVANPTGVMHA